MWVLLTCALYLLVREASGAVDACTQFSVNGFTVGTECYVKGEGASSWAEAQSRCIARNAALIAVSDVATNDFLVSQMKANNWNTAWTGGYLKPTPWTWVTSGSETIVNDQGCFNDVTSNGAIRDLPREVNIDEWRNSPEQIPVQCQKICQNEGFTYAGVQYTQTQQKFNCFCGVSFGRYGQSGACDVTCDMGCGGDDKNQIYDLSPSVVSDRGCYSDNTTSRDLPVLMNIDQWRSSPDQIPAECQKLCKNNGYKYAGVQYSTGQGRFNCFCGNTYGKYGQTTGCDRKCDAVTSKVFCGGVNVNRVYRIDGGFIKWGNKQPNGDAQGHYCAMINQRNDFDFADFECRFLARYVCDIPSTTCPAAPSGNERHTFISNVTKTCMFLSTEYKSWDGSREECKKLGGDLAVISDPRLLEEVKVVARYIAKALSASDDHYWVATTSSKWAWPDGTRLLYTNWRGNYPEPDVQYGGRCIAVDRDPSTGWYTWINANCNTTSEYFCQMDKTITSTTTQTTKTTAQPTTTTTTTTTTPTVSTTVTTVISTTATTLSLTSLPLTSNPTSNQTQSHKTDKTIASTTTQTTNTTTQPTTTTTISAINPTASTNGTTIISTTATTLSLTSLPLITNPVSSQTPSHDSGAFTTTAPSTSTPLPTTIATTTTTIPRTTTVSTTTTSATTSAATPTSTNAAATTTTTDTTIIAATTIPTTTNVVTTKGFVTNVKSTSDSTTGVTVATDPPTTSTSTVAMTTNSNSSVQTTTELVITGLNTPDTGASTGASSGLTTFQIVLIFVLVFLLVAIIVAVAVFIYYKKKHTNKQVTPSKYDTGEDGLPHPQEAHTSANGLAFKDSSALGNGYANGSAGKYKNDIQTDSNGKWQSNRIYIEQ